MQTVAEKKAELRKAIRERIRELGAERVCLSNEAICTQVTKNLEEYALARTVFCFVGTPAEIDTKPIILHALGEGKTVAVPLCTGPGIMEARRISGLEDLRPDGAYGILEPAPVCERLFPETIDLAIVPCISCDRNGGRLGQGGGYYDRFMEGRTFAAIALCREELMTEAVPAEPWDLPVDAVVSEDCIYRCENVL